MAERRWVVIDLILIAIVMLAWLALPDTSDGVEWQRPVVPVAQPVGARVIPPSHAPIPALARVRGVASWYPADGLIAAAGPALRSALGSSWRGQLVEVCADRCVVVALVDWCQCYKGERRERVVDLADDAFARLAPLSVGVVSVTVKPLGISPPATDTEELTVDDTLGFITIVALFVAGLGVLGLIDWAWRARRDHRDARRRNHVSRRR